MEIKLIFAVISMIVFIINETSYKAYADKNEALYYILNYILFMLMLIYINIIQ